MAVMVVVMMIMAVMVAAPAPADADRDSDLGLRRGGREEEAREGQHPQEKEELCCVFHQAR